MKFLITSYLEKLPNKHLEEFSFTLPTQRKQIDCTNVSKLPLTNVDIFLSNDIPNTSNNKVPTIGIIFVTFLGMGVIVWTMAVIHIFCILAIYCLSTRVTHTRRRQLIKIDWTYKS